MFGEASISISDACSDRAHGVSRIDDTVIVRFILFAEASMNISDACSNLPHGVSRNDDTVIVRFTLFAEASMNISDACSNRAHGVSRIDDTVIVRFTLFRNQAALQEKEGIKKWSKSSSGFSKSQIRPTDQSKQYVNSLSNVDFVYADIKCRLIIHFSNNNESFFD